MHRKRYFPADLEPYPLHYAALRGYTDKVRELLADAGTNPYEPIQDGETALHVALAENQPEVADILIEKFRTDFDTVGDYLVNKLECDPDDRFWLRRSILVATTKEQCEKVKQLEDPGGCAKDGILVLLRYPVGGEHAASLKSNKNNRMELINLGKTLFSNGLLSWNDSGPAGSCDSLLILSAYHGHVKQLETLESYGADLSIRGTKKQIPFHAACDASQHEVIEVLLTKYLKKFDPLTLDCDSFNGLYYILYRKNKKSFALALNTMIEYEVSRSGESESKAFNKILNVENDNWPQFSVWSQLDCEFWSPILEQACEKYEYDLTYQWKDYTALLDMIQYKKVARYYQAQIRRNPELVKVSSNGFTALHQLISSNELVLVKDLYSRMKQQMKAIFECEAAFDTFNSMMHWSYNEMINFVLENHANFLHNSLSKFHEKVIQGFSCPNFNDSFEILIKYIPDIEPLIKERRDYLNSYSISTQNDSCETYNKLRDDFQSALEEIQQSSKSLDDYNSQVCCFMHQAIIEDQLQLVENLLNANVDFDFLNNDERHAIHFVQSVEMLQLLVRKHPDGNGLVNRKDRNGATLLHAICPTSIACKEKIILELLKLGAKVDECTNDQSTALFYVYDEELFDFLTKGVQEHGFSGIDVNHRDFEGNTALHRCLRHFNSYMARVMLLRADSFVSFNSKGESLLACLARVDLSIFDIYFKPVLLEQEEKTRLMFEAELEKSKERASQIFVEACVFLNLFIVERMLAMELDFNAQGYNGKTGLLALMEAYENFPVKLMLQLLNKPVDVNIRDIDGRNALLMLVFKFPTLKPQGANVELARKIIELGVDIDQADNEGNTALHYACKIADFDMIEALVEKGADFRIRNKRGLLCYQMASWGVEQILATLFST
uniref:Ankyrin repeat domain-containing protein 50 n=1 Tax=Culex pipiens TaxID=7175 RepID=A0A8D8CBI9_CULPI